MWHVAQDLSSAFRLTPLRERGPQAQLVAGDVPVPETLHPTDSILWPFLLGGSPYLYVVAPQRWRGSPEGGTHGCLISEAEDRSRTGRRGHTVRVHDSAQVLLPTGHQSGVPSLCQKQKTNPKLSMLTWSSYPASLIYEDLTRRGPSAEAAGLARAFWRLDLLQDSGNSPEMPLRGQLRLLIRQGWPPQPFRRPHHTLRSLTSFP